MNFRRIVLLLPVLILITAIVIPVPSTAKTTPVIKGLGLTEKVKQVKDL